jgi:hypothetical protein
VGLDAGFYFSLGLNLILHLCMSVGVLGDDIPMAFCGWFRRTDRVDLE